MFLRLTKYNDLAAQLKDAKEQIEFLEKILKSIRDKNDNAYVVFDFSAVKVISSERDCWKTEQLRTIITYIFNDQIRESKYYCSLAEHEDLIKRFKDYKEVK